MINTITRILDIPAEFHSRSKNNETFRTQDAERLQRNHDGISIKLDYSSSSELSCLFCRSAQPLSQTTLGIKLAASPEYQITATGAGGWIIGNQDDKAPYYWLPRLPVARVINSQNQILEEHNVQLHDLSLGKDEFSFSLSQNPNEILDFVILELGANKRKLVDELASLSSLEKTPIFLWGSHTKYKKPADLFLYLIHGFIYENRTSWPYYRKICSENDAHALFVTLTGLQQKTGKEIYRFLRGQIILSVLSRQGEDGAWRHGEWSNDMESHFRLHCSGMHLLMDALSLGKDSYIEDSLRKAASFISKQCDESKVGTWFLHDELELNEESMRKSPFKWVRSNAFGKKASNMLVLNTHLDTMIAIDRYRSITGDQQYSQRILSARNATKAILNAKPAEQLYRLIFRIIRLTLLATDQASRLPAATRIFKRLGWKYLIPNLQLIKRIFPRINMPGGYIDRALALKGISPAYQSINLMDLVRYIHRFPDDISLDQIKDALDFHHQSSFREYLAESIKRDYALGFWAEALYHLCIIENDIKYREWLAAALVDLKKKKIGLPPSILGGNMEAVSKPSETRLEYDIQASIVMADLSNRLRSEFLLVNTGSRPETIYLKSSSLVLFSEKLEDTPDHIDKQLSLSSGTWASVQPI